MLIQEADQREVVFCLKAESTTRNLRADTVRIKPLWKHRFWGCGGKEWEVLSAWVGHLLGSPLSSLAAVAEAQIPTRTGS